jgi:hypothetical protein
MNNGQIAATILEQLGGHKFTFATGVKNLMAIENGIVMNLPRCSSKANRLKITLNSMDTYDVEFYRQTISRKTYDVTIKMVNKIEGAYDDMLAPLFEQETGMYTRPF